MIERTTENSNSYETTNSVEITRGQRGTYGWTIKVRFPIDGEVHDALAKMIIIDGQLRKDYPTEAQ